MKAPKIGRPKLPKGERKGKLLGVRFTDAERKELDGAADAVRATLSTWARDVLLAAVRAQAVASLPVVVTVVQSASVPATA